MTEHDPRPARESANLARRLNDRQPDTVLLLARQAPGGRLDATAAGILGADSCASAATVPDGRVELRLALLPGPGLRERLGVLLRQTRAGLSADVPLTSLEVQLGGGHR